MNYLIATEIIGYIILVGVTLIFIHAFTTELIKDNKRDRLWKKARKTIKKYECDSCAGNRAKLKVEIADTWRQYKKLWEENRWKEVSRKKVEEIENYLISEGILGV